MRNISRLAAAHALATLVCVCLAATATAPKTAQKKTAAKTSTSSAAAAKKPASPKKAGASSAKSTPAKTGASKTTAAKAGTAKQAAAAKSTVASKRGKKSSKKAVTWRNRQMTPGPDRYLEISRALAAKGFLSPESVSSQWSQSSAEALKKFQANQNLEATGKIDALSLIALGLGPRHQASAAKPPASSPASGQPPQAQ